jgi:SAM-dependent methyltransferase
LIRPGGTVLDVACGSGRHARWLARQGLRVTGVDRDGPALASLRGTPGVDELVEADIEQGPWPFAGRTFDAVLVANYLWRPLFPQLRAAVGQGGLLIHETFADGQQAIGRPSRAEFLLQPGELLRVATGLRVVAYEDGFAASPDRYLQRIVAVRAVPGGDAPPRYRLDAGG